MAIKPRVFKINLQIADLDRHYYNEHLITIAQHPSETDERMMVRILAFALNASDSLSFAEGLSDQQQADLWARDHNEEISLWISVGLPDDKLLKKAVGRASQVIVYSYGGRPAEVWWNKLKPPESANLRVIRLIESETQALAALLERGMKLNFMIQDGEVLISNEQMSLAIKPQVLK